MTTFFPKAVLATAAALMLLTTTARVQAAPLGAQVEESAIKVAEMIKGQGYNNVSVQVVGPPTYPGSGPAMCKEYLCSALTKQGIEIKRLRADVGLSCELRLEEEKVGETVNRLDLYFTMNFVDRNSKPILSLDTAPIKIFEREEICQVLGIPFDGVVKVQPSTPPVVPPGASPAPPPNPYIDGYLQPDQHVNNGSVIRAAQGGPFAIEILVRGQGKPVSVEDGLAFVALQEHEECEIRLINDAPYEVGVDLTLDGLSCFYFHPRKSGLWIVPPHSHVVVKGWQLDQNVARTFKVVPFEFSVAAQAGATGEIGVIAAAFYHSYQEHEQIPPYDLSNSPAKGLGIGAGDTVKSAVNTVQRRFGKLQANVPVRYEKPAKY